MTRRYPFALLAAAMGLSEHQACLRLRISGKTEQHYRRDGMTELVADRMAVKAHLVPYEVWPEMLTHQLEAVSRECAADDCFERFLPAQPTQRYCCAACSSRHRRRVRYHSDPAYRAARLATSARYYSEAGEYVRRRNLAAKRRLREVA